MEELPVASNAMSTQQLWILIIWFLSITGFYVYLCRRNPEQRLIFHPMMRD